MKAILAIAFAAAVPVCALAGEPAVVQQLRNDIGGKSVTLATGVAGYSCIYSSNLSFPTRRLVDTEIDPQGGTRYLLRADRFMNVTNCPQPLGRTASMYGDYIPAKMVSRMYPAGSAATVKTIEAKPDRIEILLLPEGALAGDNAYAKLKLMLGKGYESLSLEQVETALAQGIRMTRIESIQQLRASLDNVNRSIANLERQLATERDPATRVIVAGSLLTGYQEQAGVVDRLNAVAFEPVPAGRGASRVAELNTIIAQEQRQVQAEKIQKASAKYSTAMLAMKQTCGRIGREPAGNLSELDHQDLVVQTAQTDLGHFVEARQEMMTLGQPIPPADDQFSLSCNADAARAADRSARQRPELVQQEAKEAERRRQQEAEAAEQRRQQEAEAAEQRRRQQVRAEIADLTDEFAKMKQERAAYDTKLMGALGGQGQSTVFAEYRAHLRRMIANRQQALKLGDDAAQAEIASLENDLKKLH
jgi:hypothetical protein